MIIYAEYLFLENFISGIMILYLTGKIAGMHITKIRLIIGGVMCGIFSFIIFIKIDPEIISLLLKTIFAVTAVRIVFGIKPLYNRRNLKLALIFYIVTFLAGGITTASLYMSGSYGIAANGYVYMGMPTYFKVALGTVISYILISFFAGFIKKRVCDDELKYIVHIFAEANEFVFKGYADTGNHLRDPISGKPVSVISEGAAKMIFDTMSDTEKEKRFYVVPFSAAGTKSGIMQGIRADKAIIKSSGGEEVVCEFENPVFAIYQGEFKKVRDEDKYEVLLNSDVIRGGIV